MERSEIKTLKRSNPNLRSTKSEQKNKQGSKKVKQSQLKDETKIQKIQTKHSLDPQCFICASSYNLNRKLPVVACKNKHTFCLNCITLSIQSSKLKCPTCRCPMDPTQLNFTLYEQVLTSYKQKNKHLQTIFTTNKLTKLGVKKFSKKLSNFDDFESLARSNKFTKIKRNKEPSLLILQPQIKEKSSCSFSFIYFPVSKVQISFGVCIYDKFLLKMVENCGFDTKIIDFFMKKSESIIKVHGNQGLKIIVNVNLQKYEIHWFSQKDSNKKGQKHVYLVSSQQIELNKKVGDLAYYPYLVLYNVGDSVQLNK